MIGIALLLQAGEAAAPSWGALGVGGVLAGMMFYFYRQDRKESEARWYSIISDQRALIQSNTEAMTALREAVMDGHEHVDQGRAARGVRR